MRTGTGYFKDLASACAYYKEYGFMGKEVSDKIQAGEIHVDAFPPIKPGERIELNKAEGRYFICTE